MSLSVVRPQGGDGVGRAMHDQFAKAERTEDQAIIEQCDLITGIIRASHSLGLEHWVAQNVIASATGLLNHKVEGRAKTVELHRDVAILGRKLGIDTRAFGCPEDTFVGPLFTTQEAGNRGIGELKAA